jgi:poly(A) polymerase Pap1
MSSISFWHDEHSRSVPRLQATQRRGNTKSSSLWVAACQVGSGFNNSFPGRVACAMVVGTSCALYPGWVSSGGLFMVTPSPGGCLEAAEGGPE